MSEAACLQTLALALFQIFTVYIYNDLHHVHHFIWSLCDAVSSTRSDGC